VDATRRGAYDFLEKPLDTARLFVTLRNALDMKGLKKSVESLQTEVESRYEIVGSSPRIRRMLTLIEKVAPTRARVLVTAGPTREFLDPVRFISNRSSGRQGFALAEAARDAGAAVTLVAGPVHLATPAGVDRIDVVSAQEMKTVVAARAGAADIFVSVAAVADYRPSAMLARKLKKREQGAGDMRLALEENEDIVGAIASASKRPFVVGFAAETHGALEYARDKRRRKRMDAIVVNDVSDAAIGFDSDDNAVTLIHAGGEIPLAKMSKDAIARRLVAEIATLYAAARP